MPSPAAGSAPFTDMDKSFAVGILLLKEGSFVFLDAKKKTNVEGQQGLFPIFVLRFGQLVCWFLDL